MNSLTSDSNGIMRFFAALENGDVRQQVVTAVTSMEESLNDYKQQHELEAVSPYQLKLKPYSPFLGPKGEEVGTQGSTKEQPNKPKTKLTEETVDEPTKKPTKESSQESTEVKGKEEEDDPFVTWSLANLAKNTPTKPKTATNTPQSAQTGPLQKPPRTFLHECNDIAELAIELQSDALGNLIERFNMQLPCRLDGLTAFRQLTNLFESDNCKQFVIQSQKKYMEDNANYIKENANNETDAVQTALRNELRYASLFVPKEAAKYCQSNTKISDIKANVNCLSGLTCSRVVELYSIERAQSLNTFFTQCNDAFNRINEDIRPIINKIAGAYNTAHPNRRISFKQQLPQLIQTTFKFAPDECIKQQIGTLDKVVKAYIAKNKEISVEDFYQLWLREGVAQNLVDNQKNGLLANSLGWISMNFLCGTESNKSDNIDDFVDDEFRNCLACVRIWKTLRPSI